MSNQPADLIELMKKIDLEQIDEQPVRELAEEEQEIAEVPVAATQDRRLRSRLKFFKDDQGWGGIWPTRGVDGSFIYFRPDNLEDDIGEGLVEGELLEFDLEKTSIRATR